MKFILTIILFISTCSLLLLSQTKKIKDLEGERKVVIKEIATTTQLLDNTQKSTATILDRINLLSKQMSSRSQVISLLNQEIDLIAKEQNRIEADIVVLESSLKAEQDAYAKAVKSVVARKQQTNKLLFILSGKSFSESIRRMQFLKNYSQWRKHQADVIKDKQLELHEKQTLLNKTKVEKISLLANRQGEQAKLQDEEKTHQKEVEEAKGKENELRALLIEKHKKADNLNSQIQKLIAEEVARQEREAKRLAEEHERKRKAEELAARQKAEQEAAKKANQQTKTIPSVTSKKTEPTKAIASSATTYVSKENIQMSSSFAANKGKLPMPISGNSTIVGRFGVHQHDRWKVSTNNNGVDIKSQAGAQARVVFDGEVSRIVSFPGFNNCIIIRHGGYYTFYGNIQNVSVKQGQKVSTNQVLGVVYTDTDTNSSTLHFQLWQGTTKLNPEPWIR